jgi:prolactin regulatory element-binding protein
MSGGKKQRVKFTRPTSRNEDSEAVCGAWVPQRAGSVTDAPSTFVLLGRDHDQKGVAVREYNFDTDTLSDTVHAIGTEDGRPLQLVVHPTGSGVLCVFANSCKYYDIINPKGGPVQLKASELDLSNLQGLGLQTGVRFNIDGSVLVTGGKDGHLRVFAWPTCELALNQPNAHRSIHDFDISYDSAYVATMAEDNASLRIWDIAKGESIAQLQKLKDEKFSCCRFSQDGSQAFLFVSITKGRRGYVGVWNMVDWSRIGSKKLSDDPITSLAVSRNGKWMGLGTTEGDLIVVVVKKMEASQIVRGAHASPVTDIAFSKHGRSLLSVGSDSTARISRLQKSEWREWQLYAMLIGMIILSAILFLGFSESTLADDFWQFPMGRNQPARPPPEAVWGHQPSHQEL